MAETKTKAGKSTPPLLSGEGAGGRGHVYVIAYDIVCDKKRRKVADILLDYGLRMQKSVFECALDAKTLAELTQKLSAVIDPKQDSVLFYMLCKACMKQHHFLGLEPFRPEKGFDIL